MFGSDPNPEATRAETFQRIGRKLLRQDLSRPCVYWAAPLWRALAPKRRHGDTPAARSTRERAVEVRQFTQGGARATDGAISGAPLVPLCSVRQVAAVSVG